MNSQNENYINSVNLNGGTDFPYLVLDVINGTIQLRTLDCTENIAAGEGLFINKNVVHLIEHHGEHHYNSFVFPDYFLEFYIGSPVKGSVESITENEQIQFYHFRKDAPWCEKAISILQELSMLEKSKKDFYTYEVLVLLSSLWLTMRKNILIPPTEPENTVNARMQKFLAYIEQHYAEDVTLGDIARCANVSKSECLRCFKLSMQTTPYKYLLEVRLSKAAELLNKTDEPIGDISSKVGFHQMSHFGRCFREKTGYAPREYRVQKKENEHSI